MDELSRRYYGDLRSDDADVRYEAFRYLMKETQLPVDWAYEVWDELLALSGNGNHHERSIATQLLSNLSKSDPGKRILHDLDRLMIVTKDSNEATARHTLQSLWKIGVTSKEHQELLIEKLTLRYQESIAGAGDSGVRYDIIECFRKMYGQFRDETVKDRAIALVSTDPDARNQKKSLNLWNRL